MEFIEAPTEQRFSIQELAKDSHNSLNLRSEGAYYNDPGPYPIVHVRKGVVVRHFYGPLCTRPKCD